MGIFGGQNRVKSQSAATTLIAEGCTINGNIQVANRLQIDGHVEGQIEVINQIKISASGKVSGEITTERLIINGHFEGTCYANYVEILSSGDVVGTIYSDNLSIEAGGKFVGNTKPAKTAASKQEIEGLAQTKHSKQETKDIDKKVSLISNSPSS
ncbi:bactofilin family protein [Marinomonas spartinae]|uniref:bactofilin family protein n=1 Tax=Marinomonas spartinae TaxID=1792290 RepID=UPI0018F18BD4|nr:polymer-forming cytoskeletal protein [Marinomonas spartinae]MBJ7555527.1 polymer-forming cytoskeletal protein [Marinomonas spartinae]